MIKSDMKAFQKNRDDKTNKVEKSPKEKAVKAKEKTIASPALGGGRRKVTGMRKAERRILHMPISKKDIELSAIMVNPLDCLIHPKNRRIQSLLRESNPKVMELKNSLLEEGQREPVLARHITVDGEQKIEIIDGSRRRFVSELIAKENPDFKLKIWLGREISDQDAEYLTKVENELQENISVWETAQYLKGVSESNLGWTNTLIASNEKMPESSVSLYLTLSGVPMGIIERLESPDVLTLASGVPLMRILNKLDEKSYKSLLVELNKLELFKSSKDLLRSVSDLTKPKKATQTPTANKKVEFKSGDKVRAVIGKNRSKEGQYKLDLFDVSADEFKKLADAIEKILT